MLDMNRPASPELTSAEKRRLTYPYYAGFSEGFVNSVLDMFGASEGSMILDPWNGSGTTTSVASRRGLRATGIDLNPISAIVSRARLAGLSDAERLMSIAAAVDKRRLRRRASSADHLLAWYSAFRRAADVLEVPLGHRVKALALCTCFRTARLLSRKTRTRNPTWYQHSSSADILDLDDFVSAIVDSIVYISTTKSFDAQSMQKYRPRLATADLNTITLPLDSYNFVVTSPPYLTRIDYVRATLPELEFLTLVEGGLSPRNFVFSWPATVLIQPKASSMRLRMRWLTA